MSDARISFDHVHLVAKDPDATVRWFAEKLGAEVRKRADVAGAPQIYMGLGGALVIIRAQRPGEKAGDKGGLEWGLDHFGMYVQGDFDAYCADLKKKGVHFVVEPKDNSPTTRVAFIEAPDKVTIELLCRKEQV
jgi:lactoylglutathione lyase